MVDYCARLKTCIRCTSSIFSTATRTMCRAPQNEGNPAPILWSLKLPAICDNRASLQHTSDTCRWLSAYAPSLSQCWRNHGNQRTLVVLPINTLDYLRVYSHKLVCAIHSRVLQDAVRTARVVVQVAGHVIHLPQPHSIAQDGTAQYNF